MAADPIPEGMNGPLAYLFVADAGAALDWYAANLGGTETMRMPGPGGTGVMHGQIELGGRTLMLSDANPEWGSTAPDPDKPYSVKLMLYVPDVDTMIAGCAAAGAEVTMPADDMFWGDRMGEIRDPFGHKWMLATHTEDMTPEEIVERGRTAFGG